MQELVIDTIGHYRPQHLLGRGGMAKVYLAQDTQTGEQVAMKLIHRSMTDYCERFRSEAETLATLSHEHILPFIEYGECGLWQYLVTPYIPGGTLAQRLKKGPLSCEHAGELLDQLAQALQFSHERRLVHRDIKPSNVLMRDEHFLYLADFGLAQYLDETEDLTPRGCILGTPEYMAPECSEEKATPLSDLYSLGILLYQMVTGKLPFLGDNAISICLKHLNTVPPLPSSFNSDISEAVEDTILHALEKDPQKRFQTVQEFSRAYRQALGADQRTQMMTGTQIHVPLLNAPQASIHKIRQRRRGRSLATAMLALAVLVCILSGLFALPQEKPSFPAHAPQGSLPPQANGVIPTPTPVPGTKGSFQDPVNPQTKTLQVGTRGGQPANGEQGGGNTISNDGPNRDEEGRK